MQPVNRRRPEEFEIVEQEGEGKGGDGFFVDTGFCEAGGEGGGDHGKGGGRREAEEQGAQRRALEIAGDCGLPALVWRGGLHAFSTLAAAALARNGGYGALYSG